MSHYVALIHKDAKSDYGVSFPDFPGCITAGSSLQEALQMAEEALEGHIAVLGEEGQPIPEPSSVDAIMASPDNRDGVAILVTASKADNKPVRVNVTLPAGLLRRIDQRTSNRSRFLAQAAEHELEKR